MGFALLFTTCLHSECSGGVNVTSSWLPGQSEKAMDMCWPQQFLEPVLDNGEGSYQALKNNIFTVMYDREGANGLMDPLTFFLPSPFLSVCDRVAEL